MSGDILTSIDDALEDWAQSSDDAMRWQPDPGPFVPLTGQQLRMVRQVAHDTGLDGYAAWLAVADVMSFGPASPYAEFMRPGAPGGPGHGRGICPWCTRAGKGQRWNP
jgi:hypothetical protein